MGEYEAYYEIVLNKFAQALIDLNQKTPDSRSNADRYLDVLFEINEEIK